MKMYYRLLMLLLFANNIIYAQTPKRELRAAWIATVSNIDWPSQRGLPSHIQQQEFIERLDKLKALGCNAVIVQIRPAADAFYPSPYEPWSRYLTDKQGKAPEPYYDPLQFMIEQTHMRCMEFHAWFNPFRALTSSKYNPNPASHITRTHPEWIINYGSKSYLNPGEPDARAYVIKVIKDVVKRYDIDAVHLDDYFYPYRIAGLNFGDYKSYTKYGKRFANRDEWRRANVNQFVVALNTEIKKQKPYVKFGISPFGVWRNADKDPRGSATRGGQTCYDDLYSDILLWLKNGWIDYAMPQLYWEHGHKAAAFDVLLPWWENHSYDRHIYYGLGVYRMLKAKSGPWVGSKELVWQIKDIRTSAATPGYAFYSSSNFDKLSDAINKNVSNQNKYMAIPPAMKWLDSTAPLAPILRLSKSTQGVLLRWNMPFNNTDTNLRYAVYRFVNNEPVNLNDASKILTILNGTSFNDSDAKNYRQCTYIVTALDRIWNESNPSNEITIDKE